LSNALTLHRIFSNGRISMYFGNSEIKPEEYERLKQLLDKDKVSHSLQSKGST